jgi:hypothetical protein
MADSQPKAMRNDREHFTLITNQNSKSYPYDFGLAWRQDMTNVVLASISCKTTIVYDEHCKLNSGTIRDMVREKKMLMIGQDTWCKEIHDLYDQVAIVERIKKIDVDTLKFIISLFGVFGEYFDQLAARMFWLIHYE